MEALREYGKKHGKKHRQEIIRYTPHCPGTAATEVLKNIDENSGNH